MLENFVQCEQLDDQQTGELIEALKENTDDFTTLKLIEELAELQEKLIKYHLKSKEHKPKVKEILDEMGDVMLRLLLFSERLDANNPDLDVSGYLAERLEKKLTKMYGYVKEGKYKGGL